MKSADPTRTELFCRNCWMLLSLVGLQVSAASLVYSAETEEEAPALTQVKIAEDRCQQSFNNLRVALALAAWHSEHDEYPLTLDELSPEILSEVPTDLFTGRALVYLPNQDGYLLYSIGPNLVDDGGRERGKTHGTDDIRVLMPVEVDLD